MLSARKQPEIVDKLIQYEMEKGYLDGPYDIPPYSVYRISPIGISQGKYSKKYRLIVDLSSPHNQSSETSINDLIDKDEYSLQYVRIDDAISILKTLGSESLMCKTDIVDAFKLIPIAKDVQPYYGIKWREKYFFYKRLVFGCRSSPKIFDMLSQAICWIIQNNYNVKNILHLLDDFITFDPPGEGGLRSMAVLTMVFKKLGIPISEKKTVGPDTVIEYLGIILDSKIMESRIPLEKVDRILTLINNLRVKKSCTKRELLSVLGHFNFAARVIPAGRSFTSYLLTLAHSVSELHYHVYLTSECRKDLAMWEKFLQGWNGKSFFLEEYVTNTTDISLFTDASSNHGFGGYYAGRWFQGKWPEEIHNLGNDPISMALLELYPIVVAVVLWGHEWSGKRIKFLCDNLATVQIIRKRRSKSAIIMKLMRKLTWKSACENFLILCDHVPGKENVIADSLSRFQMARFREAAPTASKDPVNIPSLQELVLY